MLLGINSICDILVRFYQSILGSCLFIGCFFGVCIGFLKTCVCSREFFLGGFDIRFQLLKALFSKHYQLLLFLDIGSSSIHISLRLFDLFFRLSQFVGGLIHIILRSLGGLGSLILNILSLGQCICFFIRSHLYCGSFRFLIGFIGQLRFEVGICLICGLLGSIRNVF